MSYNWKTGKRTTVLLLAALVFAALTGAIFALRPTKALAADVHERKGAMCQEYGPGAGTESYSADVLVDHYDTVTLTDLGTDYSDIAGTKWGEQEVLDSGDDDASFVKKNIPLYWTPSANNTTRSVVFRFKMTFQRKTGRLFEIYLRGVDKGYKLGICNLADPAAQKPSTWVDKGLNAKSNSAFADNTTYLVEFGAIDFKDGSGVWEYCKINGQFWINSKAYCKSTDSTSDSAGPDKTATGGYQSNAIQIVSYLPKLTLDAVHTVNVYFASGDGVTVNEPSQELEKGAKATAPATDPAKPADEKNTYAFAGWYNGDVKWNFDDAVTEDVTLTPKFTATPIDYTVTFDTDGAPAVDTQTLHYGDAVVKPADPVKSGFLFDGWYITEGEEPDTTERRWNFDTDKVQGNMTLKAKFVEGYQVVFKVDGTETDKRAVEANEPVEKPADPAKSGYRFDGWFVTNGTTVTETEWNFATGVTEELTLSAKFVKIWNVTFAGDFVSEDPRVLDEGSLIVKPEDPSAANYNFVGWFDGSEEWDFATDKVTADVTLTAKWELVDRTVTFAGEGITPPVAATVKHGGTATAPADPVRENYRFEGWFVTEGTTVTDTEWNFDKAVTEDITLTAKFTRLYKVTFTGATVSEQQVVSGGRAVRPDDPAKEGYTFEGWYNGDTKWNFATDKVTADVTLTAKFTENAVTPPPADEEEEKSGCKKSAAGGGALVLLAGAAVAVIKRRG